MVEIQQGVVCCKSAEIDAQRENQLDELHARLTQLECRPPQDVGQDHSDKIQVLRHLEDEPGKEPAARLLNDQVRKKSGPSQQKRGPKTKISLCAHLIKDVRK